jgi:hypothetical protein
MEKSLTLGTAPKGRLGEQIADLRQPHGEQLVRAEIRRSPVMGERSDGHPVPQTLHFSNTKRCENLRQIPGASGPLSHVREAGPPRMKEFGFGPLRLELLRQAA